MFFLNEYMAINFVHCQAAMAEWLRRLTRNQMGSTRVGSNPTRSALVFKIMIAGLF